MAYKNENTKIFPLLGADNNALVWLLAVNAIIFIIINFLRIVYSFSYDDNATAEIFFNRQILNWFQLTTSFETLILRPWTLLTCMFTHYNVIQLVSNMLWLWGFGYILQDLSGNDRIIPIYLYAGMAGSVFFILSVNTFPFLSNHLDNIPPFIGAGAAVLGIAVGTTTLVPDYRIFPMINGGIPLWVLTLIYTAFDYVSIAGQNGGTAIAHLAGGAVGFFFIRQLKKGNDWGAWMHQFVSWTNDLFNPERQIRQHSPKDEMFYKRDRKPFTKVPKVTQQKLDHILDKINQEGLHLLTDEEKDFLKRAKDEL